MRRETRRTKQRIMETYLRMTGHGRRVRDIARRCLLPNREMVGSWGLRAQARRRPHTAAFWADIASVMSATLSERPLVIIARRDCPSNWEYLPARLVMFPSSTGNDYPDW